MQHVLAAIDFSPLSERVVALAAELAQGSGAWVTLLHVAAPDPDFVGYETGPQHVRDRRAQVLRHEHGELEVMAARLRQLGLRTRALLVAGPTVETVLAQARERHVDHIVVGAHRHSRAAQVLLGSVSKGIVRHAECPVTVVVPDD